MAFEPTDSDGYLQLWKLIFPDSYTNPIENAGDGEGQDVPAMMAKVWANVDSAMNGTQQSYFLKSHSIETENPSSGPTKATGTLEVRRTAPFYSSVTIPIGTLLQATTTDSGPLDSPVAQFVTTEEIQINELGPVNVQIKATLPGTAWNIEATPPLDGYGKGVPDDVDSPFPGSAYGNGPTPWARWTFVEGLAEEPTHTEISTGGTEISGSFIDSDVGRNIFVIPDVPVDVDIPHLITGITSGGSAIISPAMPLDGDASWRPATFKELGVSIVQDYSPAGDITGGTGGTLEAIGSDKRVGRSPEQSDSDYRNQICNLPEIITPVAIKDIIGGILDPKGIVWSFEEILPVVLSAETDGLMMGFTWDVHPYDFGEIGAIPKPAGSEYVGQGGVYIPAKPRVFIICVDYIKISTDKGLTYENGPFPPAWDANFFDGNVGLFDPIFLACIQQMWKAVNEARAAGVSFVIVLNDAP